MKPLIAMHNGTDVAIVGFLYEGESNETLKAIYYDEDGAIDEDVVANFTIVATGILGKLQQSNG